MGCFCFWSFVFLVDTIYFRCYYLESDTDIFVSHTYNGIRRFRRCVEAHVSRVTVRTDQAGWRIGKGARAEERYHLLGILSGCAVKSCMFVTRMMSSQNTSFGQVECYDMKKVFDDASLALLTERLPFCVMKFCQASWACRPIGRNANVADNCKSA